MDIVEFIKSEMEEKEITYEQLADKLGMSRQNLWKKLNERNQPNFGNIKKILIALGYDVSIEKTADAMEIAGNGSLEDFFLIAGSEQVSYNCVEKLLVAMGYEIKLTHKNEQNVEKGVDNSL